MIRVVVAGAVGKMGREICRTIIDDPDTHLVGAADISDVGCDIGEVVGRQNIGVPVKSLKEIFAETKVDVLVDFTIAAVVMDNLREAAKNKAHMVIGTTGLTDANRDEIKKLCSGNNVHAIIAANFAIGAVLMMKFSEMAARYMNRAEIIEYHQDQKRDAPSGTSLQTARLIASKIKPPKIESEELLDGARGAGLDNVHIHSIRLPGFVAHQEVVFGGLGQVLTIRHDSIDRTSFMPGILMAVKAVAEYPGVTVGLDKIMDL